MELSIECKTRPDSSKAKALRREGRIPASLYGHKGAESLAITVDAKDAEVLIRKASVNKTLINVSIPDQPWTGSAVLKEVHTHPASQNLYHLSFYSTSSQSAKVPPKAEPEEVKPTEASSENAE